MMHARIAVNHRKLSTDTMVEVSFVDAQAAEDERARPRAPATQPGIYVYANRSSETSDRMPGIKTALYNEFVQDLHMCLSINLYNKLKRRQAAAANN